MSSLDFLYRVSNDELEPLADILREQGGITGSLSSESSYSSRRAYIDAVINEFLDYGSNTLWSQEDYETVLNDVCDKVDVDYSHVDSVIDKENKLLGKIFSNMWEKMSAEGRRALLETMDERIDIKGDVTATFAAIFHAGGFKSYQLAVIIANSIAKFVLGRGLTFAMNAALTRALSFLSGPVGILMGIWTTVQIMGPAYRVTVPAVTYIASLRRITGR